MSFYVNNSFGKFNAESDFTDSLPANSELITGYSKALGEQHKLFTELDVTEGQTPTLAVYKHGVEGSIKHDLVAIEGSEDTYKLLKHYGEFEQESEATTQFDEKLGECADSNAEYDASTDTCGCKMGYTINAETGECDPDEVSFVEENKMAIGAGVALVALLGVFFLRR
tara:strand:+ start:465 stop:971 length:507 start_codon:yes stop_codon:yes gene_type:complete